MNTLYLNAREQDVLTKKDYLLRAVERLGFNNVVDYKGEENPDYVLNIQPYYDCFVKGRKWTGTWEIDCLIKRFRMARYWTKVDTIFTANFIPEIDEANNVFLLFQACDTELYKDVVKPVSDFNLIGSTGDIAYKKEMLDQEDVYDERMRCIDLLQRAGYSFKLVEANWQHRLPVQKYINELKTAKVQFIRSMNVGGNGEIAQRFFECLPIGPVLTNYTGDLKRMNLIEGKDYLAYRDDKEMLSKMHMLINRPEIARSIAHHGRQKAFMFHTYENRVISLLTFLKMNYGF